MEFWAAEAKEKNPTGYPDEVNTLASWLQNANHVTVLTGAGMSTESNIPDFRSKDGW